MPSLRRPIAAAAAAAVVLTVLAAPPASAGTVTVQYTCRHVIVGAPKDRTMLMEIIAPATARRGTTVTLETTITDTVNSQFDDPAGFYRGSMTIGVGGASSGSVEATGLTNRAIAAGTPFRLVDGRAQVTLPNAGDVTFRPGVWRLHATSGAVFLVCQLRSSETAAIAATTHVTAS
jgi:hypothetical protein